jgi:hypothetical protein
MTSLISELASPKPRREGDTALNARSRLAMSRAEGADSLTAKLLVAQQGDAEEADRESRDLLIRGLVDRLPQTDRVWSLDDRARWLRTAVSIFDLVYKVGDGEHREISLALAKQDAARTA